MLPEPTSIAAAAANAEPPRPSFRAALKAKCRDVLAGGLYHTRLLQLARRFEGSHELAGAAGSALPRLRRSPRTKFGILCYHRVGTEGVPLFSRLHPRVFAAQMRYLQRHYRLVPLGQLCQELREDRSVAPTLAVTFDDGYRDLYTFAFPVLQKYRIPATIYLIGQAMETGEASWYDRIFVALAHASGAALEVELETLRRFVLSTPAARLAAAWEIVCYLRAIPDGQRRTWCAAFERRLSPPPAMLENRMLDWSQVREMHAAGVSFGAHTMTHPAVSRLDAAGLESELLHSKKLLEAGLGSPVEDFAYPFGKPSDCSSAAESALAHFGYRSATTTTPGCNTAGTSPYRLRRMQLNDDPSLSSFAFNLARMFFEAPEDGAPHEAPAPALHGPAIAENRDGGRF